MGFKSGVLAPVGGDGDVTVAGSPVLKRIAI
jgi:hypothetical protein